MPELKIAPSILGVDYGRMNEHLAELAPFSDMFHVDVMDGNFVNNLTVGPPVVERIQTDVPLDCHLMISDPDKYIEAFAKAGAYSITIHAEASTDLKRDVALIKDQGVRACVAVNPATELEVIKEVLPELDMVLVMSVVPGWGGQAFMSEVLEKVSAIRAEYPELDIQIDGGISDKTAPEAVKAGANVLVSGSYILKAQSPSEAVSLLKQAIAAE